MIIKRAGCVRVGTKKGKLYIRFYYLGTQREESVNLYCSGSMKQGCRCRDHKAAEALLMEIERKIDTGLFKYQDYFPKSKTLKNLGIAPISDNITFQAYAIAWFEQQQLERSTLHAYKSTMHSKLIPFFGNMELKSIVPFHVRQFVQKLTLSPKYIKNIIGVMSVIMNSARMDRLIDSNPCELIKTPKVESVKIDVLSLDEAAKILNYTQKHFPKMTLFFAIGFYMGLRTGEIMGLKWGDFDFNNQKLTVQRTITDRAIKNSTKTSEKRTIDIPPILDRHINNHKQYTFFKSDWLFLSNQNEPFKNYSSITKFYWEPTLKACGIRYRQVYQMRHSFASNSLAAGFPLAWVQEMLGHATPSMIMKRYGNYIYKGSGRQGFSENIENEGRLRGMEK